MALIATLTTWSAGDSLTATALNAEIANIVNVLSGGSQKNVNITYNSSDVPNLTLASSGSSQEILRLNPTGASTKPLVVDAGSGNVLEILKTGVIDSKVTTGTAPFVIASTTKVDNLNADQVDGVEGSAIIANNANATITKNGATLTWSWNSDTGVAMVINDSGETNQYRLVQISEALTIDGHDGVGWENYVRFSVDNFRVEFEKEIHIESNNSAVIQTLTDQATITWDADSGSVGTVTLTDNRTLANITSAQVGGTYILIVKQDATGGRTLTLGSNYHTPSNAGVTLSTGANAVDILTIFAESATILHLVANLDSRNA
jgi:hypothetical protein